MAIMTDATGRDVAAAIRERSDLSSHVSALEVQAGQLRADLDAERSKVQPVSLGGTGAASAAGALANLGVEDHIVAEGTSGGWYYAKWANGKAECWRSSNETIDVTEQVSSIYRGRYLSRWSLPFTPVGTPVLLVDSSAQALWFVGVQNSGSTQCGFVAFSASSYANTTVAVTAHAIFNWK